MHPSVLTCLASGEGCCISRTNSSLALVPFSHCALMEQWDLLVLTAFAFYGETGTNPPDLHTLPSLCNSFRDRFRGQARGTASPSQSPPPNIVPFRDPLFRLSSLFCPVLCEVFLGAGFWRMPGFYLGLPSPCLQAVARPWGNCLLALASPCSPIGFILAGITPFLRFFLRLSLAVLFRFSPCTTGGFTASPPATPGRAGVPH